jgi:hypothetical protein
MAGNEEKTKLEDELIANILKLLGLPEINGDIMEIEENINKIYMNMKTKTTTGGESSIRGVLSDRDGRKYVSLPATEKSKRSKWYLDENRGRYRYASPDKTSVMLLGKAAKTTASAMTTNGRKRG